MKLTLKAVSSLQPERDKQRLVWDDELKGFGVLISGRTKAKSFVVQRAVNGKKRRVTLGSVAEYARAGGIERARTDAAEKLLDMRRGVDPRFRSVSSWTLAQALDDYLRQRPNLSPRTRVEYRAQVERWFHKELDEPLAALSADAIERKFDEIRKAAGYRKPSTLFVSEPGAAAANGAMRVLRAVYSHTAARSDLEPWPRDRLRGQWHHVGRRTRSIRFDDLPAFYKALQSIDGDARDAITVLLFTGLRITECLSLRWEWVDFGRSTIAIPARATKSKRPLDLPMNDVVQEVMQRRRADSGYVFPSHGTRGRRVGLRNPLRRLSGAMGKPINAHALRSTFITVAIDAGVGTEAVKGLVNHSIDATDVTMGYVNQVELADASQRVCNRMKALCEVGHD